MHPILIDLGFPIHTFGVLMGAGFLVGILGSMREATRQGLDPDEIFNLSFWIMVSGVGGARLLYVLIDVIQHGGASDFLDNPLALLAIWQGGLVWYGGLIGATITVLYYTRRYRMPVLRTCDLLAPYTFLGLAIGRVGCLMAGDDFGRPTTVPWAITFTNPKALVYPESLIGEPLHPTQLYMVAKSLFVALVCWVVLKRFKRFDGMVFGIAFLLYAPLRYVVELYRGDFQRGYVIENVLSTSQAIGIAVVAFGIAALFWAKRQAPPLRT